MTEPGNPIKNEPPIQDTDQLIKNAEEIHHRDFSQRLKQDQNFRNIITLLMERGVRKDALTGLGNRDEYNYHIGNAISRAVEGRSITVAWLDIDKFNDYNTHYSHEVGDAVLKHVADLIKSNVQKPDVVTRAGGDEFAIIFWDMDEEEAKRALKRIAQNIADNPYQHGDSSLPVRVSFGYHKITSTDRPSHILKMCSNSMLAQKQMHSGSSLTLPAETTAIPTATEPDPESSPQPLVFEKSDYQRTTARPYFRYPNRKARDSLYEAERFIGSPIPNYLRYDSEVQNIIINLVERGMRLDSLTGAGNMNEYTRQVDKAITLRNRNHKVTMAWFDIKNFKSINDEYDHSGGDAVLQHVTKIIKHNVVKGNIVTRMTGNLFAVFFWDRDEEQARGLIRGIQDALQQDPCRYKRDTIPVTLRACYHQLTATDDKKTIDRILFEKLSAEKSAFDGTGAALPEPPPQGKWTGKEGDRGASRSDDGDTPPR